jgi:hypothetical protein
MRVPVTDELKGSAVMVVTMVLLTLTAMLAFALIESARKAPRQVPIRLYAERAVRRIRRRDS